MGGYTATQLAASGQITLTPCALATVMEPLGSPNGNTQQLPPLPVSPHICGLILARFTYKFLYAFKTQFPRGGSKGIPLKNLAPLGSRPLLAWALGAVLEFGNTQFSQLLKVNNPGKFDSTWVSTDHPGIKECALACGAKVTPPHPGRLIRCHTRSLVCRHSWSQAAG